ncbi:DUF732 domain-containing protein [Mycolicibacterium sp. XJ1819]
MSGWSASGWLTALLLAALPVSLTGCSTDDMMATMGMPTSETAPAHGQSGAAPPGPLHADGHSNALLLTDRQRAYLDALSSAGVKPSSDLRALSIGSYVCHARVAKKDEQAVWDSVRPHVRSDFDSLSLSAAGPSAADVDAATADYIRIATTQLC